MPTLLCKIISARNLSEGDYSCKVSLGKASFKTKTVKKSATPEWNEVFTIQFEKLENLVLEINKHALMGSKVVATIQVANIDAFVKGMEMVLWQTDSASKAEIQVGLTPQDFGTEEKKRVATVSTAEEASMLPPMPSEAEVNRLYEQLMMKLGGVKHTTQVQASRMANLPMASKWALICGDKDLLEMSKGKIENTPQFCSSQLKADVVTLDAVKKIGFHLVHENMTFLQGFIDCGGLKNLLDILATVEKEIHRDSMTPHDARKDQEKLMLQEECIRCVDNMMGTPVGRKAILSDGVKTLGLCIDIPHEMSRIRVLKVLTAICVLPEVQNGHKLVMDAMTNYKAKKKEKARFGNLVAGLKAATGVEEKLVFVTFIHTLVNTPKDLDVRISIRGEFTRLGVPELFTKIKTATGHDIGTEDLIDEYEELAKKDEVDENERFSHLDVNINDMDDVFKKLRNETKNVGLQNNLLMLLQNLLSLPYSKEQGMKGFLLGCRIIRQISRQEALNSGEGEVGVNLNELSTTVEAEFQEAPFRAQIEELAAQVANLTKKVSAMEIEVHEKDELLRKARASGGTLPPLPSPTPVTDGPPDDIPPPPPGPDGAPDDIPPPPPGGDDDGPPPPPPGFDDPDGPPPPPPPMFGGGGMPAKKAAPKKKPRKTPNGKMKQVQWNKLPDTRLKGTVFEKFELEYKGIKINYDELEETFSQKVIEKKEKEEKEKEKVIQILDPKTSQKMSIFLSQFKQTPLEDLCDAIKNMNLKLLSLDHLNQIAGFLPSKDDIINIQLFVQNGGDASKLPPPEKFALLLDKVPNLAMRIKAFQFRLGFEPKKSDLKPDIEKLRKASDQILSSTRLPTLLEFVLEVGNYLNHGTPRGGVFGFKISSLMKIADTKSTDNTLTLLNYITIMLEKQAPDLLKIADDLGGAELAARVSLPQLTSDLASLQKDFNVIEKSLEAFKEKDKFTDQITAYLAKVREDLASMDTAFKIMQGKYADALAWVGEDEKMAPDEFFSYIMQFVTAITEAVKQNKNAAAELEKAKRREEAQVKRQQEMEQKKKQATNAEGHDSVVDELFAALQGGNLFRNRRAAAPATKDTKGTPSQPSSSSGNNNATVAPAKDAKKPPLPSAPAPQVLPVPKKVPSTTKK